MKNQKRKKKMSQETRDLQKKGNQEVFVDASCLEPPSRRCKEAQNEEIVENGPDRNRGNSRVPGDRFDSRVRR